MVEKSAQTARIAEATATLIQRAALMGAFDPLNLMPPDFLPDEKEQLLAQLGSSCEEIVKQNAPPLWRLSDAERRRVLSGLTTRDEAAALVDEVKKLSDDPFGSALRAALLGHEEPPAQATRARLDELLQARTAARVAPFAANDKASDPKPIEREIADREERARLDVVLPGELIGRDRELRAIRTFIRGELLPEPYRFDDATLGARALLLTGVGGVGKSALIASLLRDDLREGRQRRQPPVINIDFDRPNLFSADKIEILREITRQLGRRLPSYEPALSQMRDAVSDVRAAGSDQSAHLVAQKRGLDALSAALGTQREERTPRFTVILDTFEEIVVRGREVVLDLMNWFDAIRTEGGLGDMRLIVSGRAPPDLAPEEIQKRFAGHIALGGLDDEAGAELLRGDKDAGAAFYGERGRRAARAFRGHPLALRFLSRYSKGRSAAEIDALIAEGLANGAMTPDFAQVFLYTRILGRLRDPEVAKLAHPGLVLRRVTPDLIRDVLGAPCGFDALDDEAAKKLFDKLAATVWLVTREANPLVVRHRPDLRRLMLPAMMNPAGGDEKAVELRDKCYAIHKAAADWYGRRADTTSSSEQQDIESFYHEVCAAPDTDVDIKKAAKLGLGLGEDLQDLPPRARELAKIAMGRLSSVTDEEFALLQPDRQEQVRSLREKAALERGDTMTVQRSMPSDIPSAASASFAQAERDFGREINAYWAEANFEAVSEVGARAFAGLWDRAPMQSRTLLETRDDAIYTGAWKYLLSLLVTEQWPAGMRRAGDQTLLNLRAFFANGREWELPDSMIPAAAELLCWRASTFDGSERDFIETSGILGKLIVFKPEPHEVTSSFALRLEQLAAAALMRHSVDVNHQLHVRAEILRPLAPPLVYTYFAEPSATDLGAAERAERWAFGSVTRSTSRSTVPLGLSAIEETIAIWSKQHFFLPEQDVIPDLEFFFANIQGIFPELHTPVTRAMLNLDNETILHLCGLLSNRAVIWPRDLPTLFSNASDSGRDRLLAQLVRHVDRCGLLLQLATEAHSLARDGAAFDRLQALIARVEDIFHKGASPLPRV